MDEQPDYIFTQDDPRAGTEAISAWWVERWLSRRIESDDVLDEVARHTLVRDGRYPMHGACVWPPASEEVQQMLFDDLAY